MTLEGEVATQPLAARAPSPPWAGPCRMVLVQHGTATFGGQNRYRGRRDVPLDAQGYQDALDAARRLSSVGLAAVYSGPLRRTMTTAQIIADEARLPDLRVLHGLNNVDYGAWEGLTAEEASMYSPEAFELYRTAPERAVCPEGERLADARARIADAIALIGERHAGEVVAAVTHAVMIRLLVAGLTDVTGERWRTPVGRGSLTTVTVQDGKVSIAASHGRGVR